MFKLYNGIRTCPCNHDGRDKELRVDYDQSQLFVYDLDARTNMGEVKYARGFTEHPHYFTVPQMAATVHAVRNTGVLMSPSDPSSSEDSEHTTDYPDDGNPVHGFSPPSSGSEGQDPDPIEGHRRNSSTRFDFLGDMVQTPPQQEPSAQRPGNFAALLEASRTAARNVRKPEDSPGTSTREAPPTQPNTPAATPNPDSSDEDTTPSPLHTRSGQIRGPPPGPKKRQPRAK